MTNSTSDLNATPSSNTFAARLKSAREAMGLERKEVAASLHLNEKFIIMMEKDHYPEDLPPTFIRGYLRAYAKLLQIPNHELLKALEAIKPATHSNATPVLAPPPPITSSSFLMQVFTYLIMFTLIGLVGMGWYTHMSGSLLPSFADNQAHTKLATTVETSPPSANLSPAIKTVVTNTHPSYKTAKTTLAENNTDDDDTDDDTD